MYQLSISNILSKKKPLKKSRIRERPTLSTDADSRTAKVLERLGDYILYINGLYCKNTAINSVSRDSTREIEPVSSFAATS